MVNPCGICGCGPLQGIRTVSGMCSIVDLISIINSAYKLADAYSTQRPIVIEAKYGKDTEDVPYFSMHTFESVLLEVVLIWHVIRFLLDLLMGYGIDTKNECAIYPWILSTIAALISLCALELVYLSMLTGLEIFDAGQITIDTAVRVNLQRRVVIYFSAVLLTMAVYMYFLWIVLAFLSSLHANGRVMEAPGAQQEQDENQEDVQALQGGHHHEARDCPGCIAHQQPRYFSHEIDRPPPNYEEALKMIGVERNNNQGCNEINST